MLLPNARARHTFLLSGLQMNDRKPIQERPLQLQWLLHTEELIKNKELDLDLFPKKLIEGPFRESIVGVALRALRDRVDSATLDVSQGRLAEALGVHRTQLYRWFTNKTTPALDRYLGALLYLQQGVPGYRGTNEEAVFQIVASAMRMIRSEIFGEDATKPRPVECACIHAFLRHPDSLSMIGDSVNDTDQQGLIDIHVACILAVREWYPDTEVSCRQFRIAICDWLSSYLLLYFALTEREWDLFREQLT